jgi:hypothetical protein
VHPRVRASLLSITAGLSPRKISRVAARSMRAARSLHSTEIPLKALFSAPYLLHVYTLKTQNLLRFAPAAYTTRDLLKGTSRLENLWRRCSPSTIVARPCTFSLLHSCSDMRTSRACWIVPRRAHHTPKMSAGRQAALDAAGLVRERRPAESENIGTGSPGEFVLASTPSLGYVILQEHHCAWGWS